MINLEVSYPRVCKGRQIKFHYWDRLAYLRLVDEIFAQEQYGYTKGEFDVVLDIGANIGMYSLWIYDHAQTIHAIEPYGKNFECLEATVKENSLDKIKTHKTAISSMVGKVVMFTPSDPLGTKILTTEQEAKGQEEVDSTTLIEFLDNNSIEKVDMLKIDIEGVEESIFTEQSMKLLAPRIKNMIGEHISPPMMSAIKNAGYEVGEIEGKNIWYAKS